MELAIRQTSGSWRKVVIHDSGGAVRRLHSRVVGTEALERRSRRFTVRSPGVFGLSKPCELPTSKRVNPDHQRLANEPVRGLPSFYPFLSSPEQAIFSMHEPDGAPIE